MRTKGSLRDVPPGAREWRQPATLRLLLMAGLVALMGCGTSSSTTDSAGLDALDSVERKPTQSLRIAFGSCADDDAPEHPIWNAFAAADANAVLMLGDNVYADTPEFKVAPSAAAMHAEYAKLAATPGFAKLRATTPMFATWDDHDFGSNDGGAEFAFKEQAAEIFKEFWNYPASDPARNRAGVYAERRIAHADVDVQVILLDTRTFRGPLNVASRSLSCPLKNFAPNTTGTFLGEEQWAWLAEQLAKPADLRVLVSSQQVIADQHCFEKWGNFPNERLRLFEVIRSSGASNLLLLSGDRHLGEISRLPADYPGGTGFDLYEVTSSPLSARSGFGWGETNDYRIHDDNLRESQFGVLDIVRLTAGAHTGEAGSLSVTMRLLDVEGAERFTAQQSFPLPAS